MPGSIYLVPHPNAFVTERGGILGFGGNRILGLGLPLLANLSVSEFRAVLAHEFAHFYSGDTRLGPRIYKTRSAMARTLQNLSSRSAVIGVLTRFGAAALLHTIVIFVLVSYWKLFLRITQLVSRRQEYRSDELACYIAGSGAMAQGLERVHSIGAISQSFWSSVVMPTISAGCRPPIADGLHRYFSAPAVKRLASSSLERLLKNPKTSAYDTHPPLKSRLERIAAITVESDYPEDPSPALALLDDVDGLEQQLVKMLAPGLKTALKPMDWDSAGVTVWLPIWRKLVTHYSRLLANETVESIPALLRNLPKIAAEIRDEPGVLLTREQRRERAASLVWMALTIQLVEHGWTLHTQPGQLFLSHGESRVVPAEMIAALRVGKMSSADWREWCRANRLESTPLAALDH